MMLDTNNLCIPHLLHRLVEARDMQPIRYLATGVGIRKSISLVHRNYPDIVFTNLKP